MFSFLIRTQNLASQDESATQDSYWPDRPGSWTGGSGATAPNGLEKSLGRAFRLANGNFRFVWAAQYPYFGLFGWPIPLFRSVGSGPYPCFGLFGLANTLVLVCSVWPIPLFRSVPSGQYPFFGLFRLANTNFSVFLVWPKPLFRSVPFGQYPYIGLFGLANGKVSVCSVWPLPLS